jgi:hypothetical protein
MDEAHMKYRLVVRYWQQAKEGPVTDRKLRRIVWKKKLRQRVMWEADDLEDLAQIWENAWERSIATAEFQVQIRVDGKWQKADDHLRTVVI